MTAINTGLGVLFSVCAILYFLSAHCDIRVYQTIQGVSDSYDTLVDLLESIGHFLSRLEIYTKIPPTHGMTEMVIKILVELLSTLALVTKQIKQGRTSESTLGELLSHLTR